MRWWHYLWVLLLVVGCLSGYYLSRYYWGEAVSREAIVLIPTGSDFERFSDSIRSSQAFCNDARFLKLARMKGLDRTVKPGRYKLEPGMTYARLINRFKAGIQTPVRVSFNNVRTLDRLAGSVAKRLELDSAALFHTLTNDSVVQAYGYTPQTFIAMFIPNTYEFYWNCSETDFLKRMQKESERFWSDRDAKLARVGLSRNEVITLASIVYEETKRKSEMPTVAGVYINRLKQGIPLQADPTVKFALGDFTLKRILFAHLKVDSPYNTYNHSGLPPGPIAMPSIAAIDAVLDFQEHRYLYFCAKEDLSGAHNFAQTLAEHNRNAAAYSQALNRLKIR